jgi:uncharacterized protein (DUF2062 family)
MHAFRRRHYRWLKHLPRRKHLKGGRLHRILGDKLFAPELWKPSRDTIAGGLALGVFIGLTPTMGIQVFLTGLAAYFLKVNIPIAVAGSLVTNPFTAGIIYPLQYQLGVWLVGVPDPKELEGYSGMLRTFTRYAKPLSVGSILTGGVAAGLVYGLVTLLWTYARNLFGRETGSGAEDSKRNRS